MMASLSKLAMVLKTCVQIVEIGKISTQPHTFCDSIHTCCLGRGLVHYDSGTCVINVWAVWKSFQAIYCQNRI